MSSETCQMLLYSQLQGGLSDELMRSPAVSGALTYTELYCRKERGEAQSRVGEEKPVSSTKSAEIEILAKTLSITC